MNEETTEHHDLKHTVRKYIIGALKAVPEHILTLGDYEYSASFHDDGTVILTSDGGADNLILTIAVGLRAEKTELAKLFDAATTDDERNMLQELGDKAGILKKCPECKFYNDADAKTCADCGFIFPSKDENKSAKIKREHTSKLFHAMKDALDEGVNIEECLVEARRRLVRESL